MLCIYEKATESHGYQDVDLASLPVETVKSVLMNLSRIGSSLLEMRRPVSDLPFSVRALNVLRHCEILTLKELSEWGHAFPRAGTKTYMEFKTYLDQAGLPYPVAMAKHLGVTA